GIMGSTPAKDGHLVWAPSAGGPASHRHVRPMGGLVARWYLEHRGGAAITRKLSTLGTPYRGAAKALEQLVNGVHPQVAFRLGPPKASGLRNAPAGAAAAVLDEDWGGAGVRGGRVPAGLVGVVAGGVAVGAAELVAALVRPESSPLLAVGGVLVD